MGGVVGVVVTVLLCFLLIFDELEWSVIMQRVEVLSDSEDEDVLPPTQPAPKTTSSKHDATSASDSKVSDTATPSVVIPPAASEEAQRAAMEAATPFKTQGNALFAANQYLDAIDMYSKAVDASACAVGDKGRAVFFANRAACLMMLDRVPEAVEVFPTSMLCFGRLKTFTHSCVPGLLCCSED